jgi:hypothetical protein
MDYKKEMKILEKSREHYFPVMDMMLDMETSGDGRPVSINDPEIMRTVLGLIDLEYFDADAFVVNKRFGEVRGLYYRGGPVLTAKGLIQYKEHQQQRRRNQLRRLFVLLGLAALCASAIAAMLLLL